MAQSKKRNRTIIAALSACLVLLIVVVLGSRSQPPVVPVVTVTREDLTVDITSNGKVEPISPTVAHAEFPTFVKKVMAAEGQAVHHGELILTVDAADIRSQLAQARADSLAAQTDLRNARAGGSPDQVAQLQGDLAAARVQVRNLENAQKALRSLVAKQAATGDELAENEASLAKARANLNALDARKQDLAQRSAASIEAATLRFSKSQDEVQSLEEKARSASVISPVDGTLYSLPAHTGDYIKVGDTLAEMADLRHVRVRAFVDEPDLGLLEPSQDVEVTWDAKPGTIWTGHTEQVPKQVVSRGMRSVGEVLCSINNDKLELLPNTNVQVKILVHERRGVIVVPRAAVRDDEGGHYVFLFNGNKVRRRDISVGIASTSKYEVMSGLVVGDRVAEPIDQNLKNGMEVRPGEAY
jgi:HlyD family secretion protein